MTFTHARGALVQGVAVGAGVGFATGIVVAAIEAPAHFNVAFAALFCMFGALLGGLAAALVGPMNPGRKLDALEKQGGVVLAVDSDDAADIEWAKVTMRRYGASPQEKRSSLIPAGPQHRPA